MTHEFTADAGALASAVHYTAKWLQPRPMIPAHGGLRFVVTDGRLTISGFNEDVTAHASLDVTAEPGNDDSYVVSGRLLDGLSGVLNGKQATFSRDRKMVTVTCGSLRATIPVMSASEFPALPEPAALAGYVSGSALADAVRRVAPAASRDMTKQVAMTGVFISFDEADAPGEYRLTLTASDMYRGARSRILWEPDADAAPIGESALILASALADAADAFEDCEQIQVGWNTGTFSLITPTRELVGRQLDREAFRIADLDRFFTSPTTVSFMVRTKAVLSSLKALDLLRGKAIDGVSLALSPGLLTLSVNGDNFGDDEIPVEYDGPDAGLMVKSGLLRTAVETAPGDHVVISFVPLVLRPVLVTSPADPAWRHVLSPLRAPQ